MQREMQVLERVANSAEMMVVEMRTSMEAEFQMFRLEVEQKQEEVILLRADLSAARVESEALREVLGEKIQESTEHQAAFEQTRAALGRVSASEKKELELRFDLESRLSSAR